MTDKKQAEAIAAGVTEAWDFWLSQHDVSTPECVTGGVKFAIEKWLDEHTDALIQKIAEEIAKRTKP